MMKIFAQWGLTEHVSRCILVFLNVNSQNIISQFWYISTFIYSVNDYPYIYAWNFFLNYTVVVGENFPWLITCMPWSCEVIYSLWMCDSTLMAELSNHKCEARVDRAIPFCTMSLLSSGYCTFPWFYLVFACEQVGTHLNMNRCKWTLHKFSNHELFALPREQATLPQRRLHFANVWKHEHFLQDIQLNLNLECNLGITCLCNWWATLRKNGKKKCTDNTRVTSENYKWYMCTWPLPTYALPPFLAYRMLFHKWA